MLQLKIDTVGDFPIPCSSESEPLPIANSFTVAHVENYVIDVESAPGQVWAATVAVDPADRRELG